MVFIKWLGALFRVLGYVTFLLNTKVDPTKYNSVMQRALRTVANAEVYAFNYDLATPPPVAEVGLSMFTEFMDNPSNYDSILEKAEKNASREFKN